MTDWQPIETAPKDGTPVLVFGIWEGEVNGRDGEPTICLASTRNGADWVVEGTDAYAAWVRDPTHWAAVSPPTA